MSEVIGKYDIKKDNNNIEIYNPKKNKSIIIPYKIEEQRDDSK